MLSEQMKKLLMLRMNMLKTRAEGYNINPSAMTRTDYDVSRGTVFGVPVTKAPPLMDLGGYKESTDGVAYYMSPHKTRDGFKLPAEILHGENVKPGSVTHELEHALTVLLGEYKPKPTSGLYESAKADLYQPIRMKTEVVEKLLQGVVPHQSPILPEWEGRKTAANYMRKPSEFTRAAIRLHNLGQSQHREALAELLPSLAEKMQMVPEEILRLLTPSNIAGIRS